MWNILMDFYSTECPIENCNVVQNSFCLSVHFHSPNSDQFSIINTIVKDMGKFCLISGFIIASEWDTNSCEIKYFKSQNNCGIRNLKKINVKQHVNIRTIFWQAQWVDLKWSLQHTCMAQMQFLPSPRSLHGNSDYVRGRNERNFISYKFWQIYQLVCVWL